MTVWVPVTAYEDDIVDYEPFGDPQDAERADEAALAQGVGDMEPFLQDHSTEPIWDDALNAIRVLGAPAKTERWTNRA